MNLKQETLKITYEDLSYGIGTGFMVMLNYPFKMVFHFFGPNKLSNFYYVTKL